MRVDPDTVVLHVDTIISAWCGQEEEENRILLYRFQCKRTRHRNTQQLFVVARGTFRRPFSRSRLVTR
jgi:hypothetical protein